jgi:hypothetical protein
MYSTGDIIVERWLPYEPRPPPRTVRIAAATGPLPTPPRNTIIQYQPLPARIVRQFQRLGVTRADPQAYIREHGGSLLDSATLLHEARAHGVVEDLVSFVLFYLFYRTILTSFGCIILQSVPADTAINFASSTYGHADGFTGSYTGGVSEYITSGSAKYSGAVDTAFRNADTNKDGTLSPNEFDRFVRKVRK